MNEEMKVSKILVALDGSQASESALKYAIFLASRFESQLVGIYIVQEEKIGYWQFIDKHFRKELHRKGEEVLEAAERIAKERSLTMTGALQQGYAYEEIIKYIENDTQITAIVMGDHGWGLPERHILGSTTERVIREVAKREIPIAVIVVPHIPPGSSSCKIYAGPLCT